MELDKWALSISSFLFSFVKVQLFLAFIFKMLFQLDFFKVTNMLSFSFFKNIFYWFFGFFAILNFRFLILLFLKKLWLFLKVC